MGITRDTEAPLAANDGADSRRGFLRRIGAALTGLGVLGIGSEAVAARRLPPTPLAARAKGATTASTRLSLSRTPTVHRISAPPVAATDQVTSPPLSATLPSSADRLRSAISGKTGVRRFPSSMQPAGGSGRQIPTVPSGAFGGMTRVLTLAEAYAAGITLTSTGCEYVGGIYTVEAPIYYRTDRGWIGPPQMRDNRLLLNPGLSARAGARMLWVHMTTPGDTARPVPYILELSLASELADYMDDLRIKLNGETLHFSATGDGNWLTIAELPGSGDLHHEMEFSLRRNAGYFSFEFRWLNVLSR